MLSGAQDFDDLRCSGARDQGKTYERGSGRRRTELVIVEEILGLFAMSLDAAAGHATLYASLAGTGCGRGVSEREGGRRGTDSRRR